MAELFKKLEGISACVFDAYGTLFDVASPVARQQSTLGDKAADVAKLWRAKQLEYTWVRSLVGAHADFWKVTREALDFTLESLVIDEPGLADELMTDMLKLDLYSDVTSALQALAAKASAWRFCQTAALPCWIHWCAMRAWTRCLNMFSRWKK